MPWPRLGIVLFSGGWAGCVCGFCCCGGGGCDVGLVVSGGFWGVSGVVWWFGGCVWLLVLGGHTVVSQLARTSERLRREFA